MAGVLSLVGATASLAVAITGRDVVSMYTAIGVVLVLNAIVRFRLAGGQADRRR